MEQKCVIWCFKIRKVVCKVLNLIINNYFLFTGGAKTNLEFTFKNHPSGKVESGKLVIRKPGISMNDEFTISLH